MSAAAAMRFGAVIPKTLTLPDAICGSAGATVMKVASIWPAMTSCIAGPAPR
jgi:hypothetical protein